MYNPPYGGCPVAKPVQIMSAYQKKLFFLFFSENFLLLQSTYKELSLLRSQ